jgi:hypothetical protein
MTYMSSKQDRYVSLAQIATDSIKNRREYEWKVAFGLWTGIGVWTYFAVTQARILAFNDHDLRLIFWLYCCLGLVWHFCWQQPSTRAFEQDKLWKHDYMKGAVDDGFKVGCVKDLGYWEIPKMKIPFLLSQTLITIVFLLGSFISISASIDKSKADMQKENESYSAIQDSLRTALRDSILKALQDSISLIESEED